MAAVANRQVRTGLRISKRLLLGLGALSLGLAVFAYFADAAEPTLEYEVKAAFLLNFTKFTEWPPNAFSDPQTPLEICVLGKDPFGHALDDVVQGEVTNGRRLTVRRLSAPPVPQTCRVLFVDPDVKGLPKMLDGLGSGVLTVGEGRHFLQDGGAIAFIVENRRVRFDINQTAAEKSGLKLSSKLLSVAREVVK